jgi:hypothetical protein
MNTFTVSKAIELQCFILNLLFLLLSMTASHLKDWQSLMSLNRFNPSPNQRHFVTKKIKKYVF